MRIALFARVVSGFPELNPFSQTGEPEIANRTLEVISTNRSNTRKTKVSLRIDSRCELSGHVRSGALPAAVASWSFMSKLQLGGGLVLKGALPDAVGAWISARELVLSPHGFSASIPATVASWRHMEVIHLSYGHFSGAFPDSVGSWTSAEKFSIDDNKMAGALPGVCVWFRDGHLADFQKRP